MFINLMRQSTNALSRMHCQEHCLKMILCRDSDFKIEKRKFQVAVIEI